MKRDWELIRQQLTDIEEDKSPLARLPKEPIKIDQSEDEYQSELNDYNQRKNRVTGHLQLLLQAGYIEGFVFVEYLDGKVDCIANSPYLTMQGHDLLDTIRSKTVWDKVKKTAKSKGIELTFDVVKQLSSTVIKSMLE